MGSLAEYENKTIYNQILKLEEHEMLKCKKCGQDFINEKQLIYIKKKLGIETYELLCSRCRKVAVAEKLRDIYKNIPADNSL